MSNEMGAQFDDNDDDDDGHIEISNRKFLTQNFGVYIFEAHSDFSDSNVFI